MRSKLLSLVVLSMALLVSFGSSLYAQTTNSGGLAGTVTDPGNGVVPGALLELKDNAKGTILLTKTDGDGVYLYSFLLPGSYMLRVAFPSFETTEVPVNVLLGPPITLNVKLAIAPAKTSITVRGEPPLIYAENGDASTTKTELQISEVPNPGNDLTYIAQTAPGVVMNTDQVGPAITLGNFSSLGMPGSSNLFTINGMNSQRHGIQREHDWGNLHASWPEPNSRGDSREQRLFRTIRPVCWSQCELHLKVWWE